MSGLKSRLLRLTVHKGLRVTAFQESLLSTCDSFIRIEAWKEFGLRIP